MCGRRGLTCVHRGDKPVCRSQASPPCPRSRRSAPVEFKTIGALQARPASSSEQRRDLPRDGPIGGSAARISVVRRHPPRRSGRRLFRQATAGVVRASLSLAGGAFATGLSRTGSASCCALAGSAVKSVPRTRSVRPHHRMRFQTHDQARHQRRIIRVRQRCRHRHSRPVRLILSHQPRRRSLTVDANKVTRRSSFTVAARFRLPARDASAASPAHAGPWRRSAGGRAHSPSPIRRVRSRSCCPRRCAAPEIACRIASRRRARSGRRQARRSLRR